MSSEEGQFRTPPVTHAIVIYQLRFGSDSQYCKRILGKYFKRIKYNDADNIYLKPVLDRSIGDGSKCVKHSDCDFFDCKGQCNLISKTCTGGVVNNNLQIVCEKIYPTTKRD